MVVGCEIILSVFLIKPCLGEEMEKYLYLVDGKLDVITMGKCILLITTVRKQPGLTQEIGKLMIFPFMTAGMLYVVAFLIDILFILPIHIILISTLKLLS